MANNDNPPELPSGEEPKDENRFKEFFESAEQYEALGQSIELQLRELKKQLSKDLQDEFKRLEYLLSEREKTLVLREKELELREKDLQAREERLARLEAFESATSPKERSAEDDFFDEEITDFQEGEDVTEQRLPYQRKPGAKTPGVEYTPNESGVGGLPGSKLSNAVQIDRAVYQGDSVVLENGNKLIWNKQAGQYDFQFDPSDDPRIAANRGLPFTYFAVEAAYLEQGYDNPNYPHFYSQTLLGKQVWYAKTPRNRKEDNVGPAYNGWVPLEVLDKILNSQVNTRLFTGDGNFIENQDYRRAYKNYRLKYERGTYYKTANGDLYSIIERGSQVYETKGNPPAYRTDGNLKSPTYGQRVEQSTEQKSRWFKF